MTPTTIPFRDDLQVCMYVCVREDDQRVILVFLRFVVVLTWSFSLGKEDFTGRSREITVSNCTSDVSSLRIYKGQVMVFYPNIQIFPSISLYEHSLSP